MLADHSGELMLCLLLIKIVNKPECPKFGKFGLEETILTKYDMQKAGKERQEYSMNYLPILICI